MCSKFGARNYIQLNFLGGKIHHLDVTSFTPDAILLRSVGKDEKKTRRTFLRSPDAWLWSCILKSCIKGYGIFLLKFPLFLQVGSVNFARSASPTNPSIIPSSHHPIIPPSSAPPPSASTTTVSGAVGTASSTSWSSIQSPVFDGPMGQAATQRGFILTNSCHMFFCSVFATASTTLDCHQQKKRSSYCSPI